MTTQGKLLRVSEWSALVLALFVVTVRPLFPGLSETLHRNLLITMVVLMAALLVTMTAALRRRISLRAPAMTACLVAFLAVTVVTACFASYRFAAIVRMTDIIAWATLTIVLVQLLSTPFRARLAVAALVATLAVLSAHAFYQYFAEIPTLERELPRHLARLRATGKVPASFVPALLKRATSGDVFGTFVIANSFAGYLALVIPVAFAVAVTSWRQLKTRGGAAAAVVMTLVTLAGLSVLLLTRSKGGILAFALVALGAGVVWAYRRRRGVAVAAVLLALLCVATDTPEERPRFFLGDSAEVRIEYWRGSLGIIRDHPWLGVGPGNWREFYHTYRRPEGSETIYAHNDTLEIAAETGVIGLFAYLSVWVAWFLSLRRKAPAGPVDEETDAAARRSLAWLVAVLGVAAILYAMSRFVPTTETGVMILVACVVWLGVYGVQVRHLLSSDDASRGSALLRGALVAGACAFLVHSAIDFDFNVPGITRTLACVMAAALALRAQDPDRRGRSFGSATQLTLTAAVAVPTALLLAFVLLPFTDMSIALVQATNAQETHAELMAQAERAARAGDAENADRRAREAQRMLAVDIPRYLRRAIAAYPGNAEPWARLAQLEGDVLRRHPNADRTDLVRLVDRIKTLRPNDPAPWHMLAGVIAEQMAAEKDPDKAQALAKLALEQIDGAIARYPTRPQFRLMRARLLETLGRNADAAREYETALDHAARTSQKELKFPPDKIQEITRRIASLREGG